MNRKAGVQALILILGLAVLAWAGTTNLDSLTLESNLTVDGTTTLTGATTQTGALTVAGAINADGGVVLANTTDLTIGTDGGSDIGASGTEIGTAWIQTIDDGDGTVAVAAVLTSVGHTDTGAIDYSGSSSIDLTGAAPDFGSNVPTMVTSRTVWIGAERMGQGGAADPAGVELKNNKFTYQFADVTADDELYGTFAIPDDFDATNSALEFQVMYLCDDATITEGEWEIDLLSVADDDADAALGTAVTIHDTSPAQNDWSVTSAGIFAASNFSAGDVVFFRVLHDVDDPLCNAQLVNFAGLFITYTTDEIAN